MRVLNELIRRSHKYPRTYSGIKKKKKKKINRHPEKKTLSPVVYTPPPATAQNPRVVTLKTENVPAREEGEDNNNDMTCKYAFACTYIL